MAGGDDFKCFCYLTNNYTTARCNTEHPYCTIRKLVRLLETTIPEQQLDRKRMLLNDFLSACPYGFWMRDTPSVCRFVELILGNEQLLSHFRESLERILYLFAAPPTLTSSIELLNCGRDLTEYFNFLAYLLINDSAEKCTKEWTLRALWCLIDSYPLPGRSYVPLTLRRKAIGESIVAESIAEMLRVVSEEVYSVMLKFTLLLSEVSQAAGFILIKNGVINVVMLRMEPRWSHRNKNFPPTDFINSNIILNCDTAMNLLWVLLKLLKHCSTEFLEKIKPIDLQSLWSFRYAFQILIKSKHSQVERNHCLAILLLCLQYLPRSVFMQSGLFGVIAKISSQTRFTLDVNDNGIHLTSSDTDFQFKKMGILALYFTASNYSALSEYRELHVSKHLLDSIIPEVDVIWIKEQQKKLTVITLAVLPRFLPEFKKEFVEDNVLSSLLTLAQYYFRQSYDPETLLAVLRCMYSIVLLPEKVNYMIENFASDLIVHFSTQRQLLLIHHKCLNYCLSILSMARKNQDSPNLVTVKICSDYMQRTLNPTPNDFAFDPTTMICLFALLWNGLLTNAENLHCFVKIGSIYTLIDLIEKSSFPVKLVGLGLLTDLCEEGSCIPHMLTWRSKGKTLISLLLSIFKEECEMTRVRTDDNGIIQDIERPIMGIRQYEATNAPNKDPNSSPATIDLILSVRPKVYAILQLLKHRHKEAVELVNEHYKLQNQPLSPKDQITKLLAENYFQFKLGEVWCEINIDLQNVGLKPLGVDGLTMATLIRKHYQLSMKVKKIQEEILKRKFKEDIVDEYMVYKMLKESKLCSALCALKELDYMARVSEHMIRHLKKSIQNQQIEDSLALVKKENIHQTFMHNIGVTNVFGLMANVESDIDKKKEDGYEGIQLACILPDLSDNDIEKNSLPGF